MTDRVRNKKEVFSELLRLRSRVADLEATEVKLRLAAEDLERSEETARVLLNTAMDAAVLISTDGTLLALNELAAQRFGGTAKHLVGSNLFDLLPSELAAEKRARILEVARSGTPIRFVDETEGLFTDNSVHPVFGTQGRLERLAIFFRDITSQVQAEVDLRIAKEAAERADVAKSRFLANMSHELRTPLNAVIGFSEILEDQISGTLNETQLKYVGHILSSGRHLLWLINEILDLAKIESGRMELKVSRINVSEVLLSCLNMVREKAERHKLTLDLRVDSSLQRAAVLADEVRLKEIMVNLLSNAVKFTPDGGSVLVEANLKGDELVVGVSDSGIGVKPEDQERIFHPFEQVDSQLSRRHLGTGLGLALSRKLAELHGGRIWVESEGEGQGSAFRVAIPFVQAPVPTSAMVAAWLEEDVAFRVKDAGRETAGGQVATVLVADEKQTYVNPGTGMRGEEG